MANLDLFVRDWVKDGETYRQLEDNSVWRWVSYDTWENVETGEQLKDVLADGVRRWRPVLDPGRG